MAAINEDNMTKEIEFKKRHLERLKQQEQQESLKALKRFQQKPEVVGEAFDMIPT